MELKLVEKLESVLVAVGFVELTEPRNKDKKNISKMLELNRAIEKQGFVPGNKKYMSNDM